MESFAQPQELKTLLDAHKDLSQLDDIGEFLTCTFGAIFTTVINILVLND